MRYGPVNVTTFVMIGFALWVMFTRLRARSDNNWPMVFYPVIILFAAQLPGRIEPNALFTGLASALVLRFEFVGGVVGHIVKTIDFLALGAIVYYLFESTVF